MSNAIRTHGKDVWRVVLASSLGTIFEWYDFYLFVSLAANISRHFLSGVNETTALILTLLFFAAGFAVRPFGALVFGRLGDLIGRKYTLLITLLIMGTATASVGFLPDYASIGMAAPVSLVVLRLVQGFALGGEYGGAAIYVAEYAPMGRRGVFTSCVQTTATLGLLLSLVVILACRYFLGLEFEVWGWRVPFLLSIVLLAFSVYIRMTLNESPVFRTIKAQRKVSKAPLTESFARRSNLNVVILALLGGTAGQAAVWYTAHFYALFFLTQTLKIDDSTANLLFVVALALGTPLFVFFGWLSDKIGRKPIILTGCLLAALTYFPIYKAMTHYGNPAIEAAAQASPVTVFADPSSCHFQFDPIGTAEFTSACDKTTALLAQSAVPYLTAPSEVSKDVVTTIGATRIEGFDSRKITAAIGTAGYPSKADPAKVNFVMLVLLLVLQVLYAAMVYGPIAAWLVELFPTRIRYTSLSLPYHIGNGWFGGFLPAAAFAIVAATGDIYNGLWYPVVVALMTFVIGVFTLRDTKDVDIINTEGAAARA